MRVVIPNVFVGFPPERAAERERRASGDLTGSALLTPLGISRMTEEELNALTSLWREADVYFRSQASRPLFTLGDPELWLAVSVDVTGVMERLERWDDPSFEAHPRARLGAVLDLEFSKPGTDDPAGMGGTLPERFFDQFWLAMNLAFPGSLDLSDAFCEDDADNEYLPKLRALRRDGFAPTGLRNEWPPVSRLPFDVTWEWLHADMIYDLEVADTPSQIGLVTLLQIARRDWLDPANILSISAGLEALLDAGRANIGATLRTRLEEILGASSHLKPWCTRFYDLRSRVVHGDYPHIRPAAAVSFWSGVDPRRLRVERDFPSACDDGLRVQLALLQDLIRHKSRRYVFSSPHFVRE